RAQAARRRWETVVAGRIVAVDGAVSRRAGQAVVDAGVALTRGGVADRTGLDERLAAAARAVVGRNAPEAGIRSAVAATRLAGTRAGTVRIAAARRVGGVRAPAPAGVVHAGTGARTCHRRSAAAAAR